jgi:hypothetical protein
VSRLGLLEQLGQALPGSGEVEFDQELNCYLDLLIISQLRSTTIQMFILNSMKDHLGLHDILRSSEAARFNTAAASNPELRRFCKAVQRVYLAESIFRQAFDWLDAKSRIHIAGAAHRSPVSITTAAPRQGLANADFNVAYFLSEYPVTERPEEDWRSSRRFSGLMAPAHYRISRNWSRAPRVVVQSLHEHCN